MELLVVMGIIAILAAIISTVTVGAVNSGKLAKCRNNLHQIQLAMNLYQTENGYFPPWIFLSMDANFISHVKLNQLALKAYGANSEIFHCPDDPYFGKNLAELGGRDPSSYVENLGPLTYGQQLDFGIKYAPMFLISPEQEPSQSNCLLLSDDIHVMHPPEKYIDIHSGGENGVFTDGHVRWVPSFPPPGSINCKS